MMSGWRVGGEAEKVHYNAVFAAENPESAL
jgi:hypothetical protein